MARATAKVQIPASLGDVWQTYADFGEVQRWSPVVAKSFLTSASRAGVGMSRHCDLAPRGAVDETGTIWEPESRLVVRVEPAGPIVAQTVAIGLSGAESEDGAAWTSVRMTAEIELAVEAADRAEAIRETFERVLRSTLAGLRHYLATGEAVDEPTVLSLEGIGD